MSNPMNPLAFPQPAVAQIGELVALGSTIIKLDVSAVTTMPDTPNGYTATLKVMADQGDLNTEALRGQQGAPGQISFQTREQINPYVNSVADLPVLANSPDTIGRYYLIVEYDNEGVVIGQSAYVWYGTAYRKLMMGAFGPPGPMPNIQPEVELIPPTDSQGNQMPSYIETFGPRQEPSWLFELAVPAGPAGRVTPFYLFPDVDFVSKPPVKGDLVDFTGTYTANGTPVWSNIGIGNLLPQAFSMPEGAFVAYNGVAQQAAIGSLVLPPQPFAWTPVVWGHMGGTGAMLSGNPLMIGCEVLLGDAAAGKQIARGLGNSGGTINVMPHFSTNQAPNDSISPINHQAVVPAHHTNPAMGTLYVNLWNDGQLGAYNFATNDAQLFVMMMPALQEPEGLPGAAPIGTPVKVVQTTNSGLAGLFPTAVTAGNAVIVLIGGWASTTGTVVTCPQPTLNGVHVPGAFAVFNNGGTNCLQSGPGIAQPGGYWFAAWVLPDCLNNNTVGLSVTQPNVGVWSWVALEASGLGATPIVDVESSDQGGTTSTTYTSGWSGNTHHEDELVIGGTTAGGGLIGTLPGAPWTTYNETYAGFGYIIQSVMGGSYVFSGALNTTGAWTAGVAAISAGGTTRRRRR